MKWGPNASMWISKRNIRAIGLCDYSGFLKHHDEMSFQWIYQGNGLVNTGYLVHKKYKDKPNAQSLKPRLSIDPIPVRNPRIDPYYTSF